MSISVATCSHRFVCAVRLFCGLPNRQPFSSGSLLLAIKSDDEAKKG
jgi:hypothetical protein